jgi:pyruvate,water dikinase
MGNGAELRFLDPHDVPPPEGVDGWERMYSPAYRFTPKGEDPERAKYESERLWIWDSLHQPPVPWPMSTDLYDTVWWPRLNQFNTNVFCLPPAAGLDHRMLYGYPYLSSTPIEDPNLIGERAAEFNKRVGHYYGNWEAMMENLRKKSLENSNKMAAISFKDLPIVVDESDVSSYRGTYCYTEMEMNWRRMIDYWEIGFDYHFEAFNIAHAAHLAFSDFCKTSFPDITDDIVAKFVTGLDSDIYRPEESIQQLSRLAMDLGVHEALVQPGGFSEVEARLEQTDGGRKWLKSLEEKKYPWFYFTTGYSIITPLDTSWIEDMELPLNLMRGYIERLKRGEVIERQREALCEESDKLFGGYRNILQEEARPQFDQLRALDRTTSPHIEGHMFWFECLHNYQIRRGLDELGEVFTNVGLVNEPGDVWYLRIWEVEELIQDYVRFKTTNPFTGRPPSAYYWPKEIKWRKEVCQRLAEWTPPNALGVAPAEIQDPFYIGLWGITTERIAVWHEAATVRPEDVVAMKGFASAPGVAEGVARVLTDVSRIGEVQEGEILVCRTTAPSWGPIFGKVKAVVADVGGMMCHSSIVSREYGIPAVTGTGNSTTAVKTGDLIRVDGDKGVATIVERA